MPYIPKSSNFLLSSLHLLLLCVFTCTTFINTKLRVSLIVCRLMINFELNSQIVTPSETNVSATFTFTSTFAIHDTLLKRPPGLL